MPLSDAEITAILAAEAAPGPPAPRWSRRPWPAARGQRFGGGGAGRRGAVGRAALGRGAGRGAAGRGRAAVKGSNLLAAVVVGRLPHPRRGDLRFGRRDARRRGSGRRRRGPDAAATPDRRPGTTNPGTRSAAPNSTPPGTPQHTAGRGARRGAGRRRDRRRSVRGRRAAARDRRADRPDAARRRPLQPGDRAAAAPGPARASRQSAESSVRIASR